MKAHLLPLLFFCFSTSLSPSRFIADAARILIYCPSISKSHVLLCSKYADLLHNASHDTVLFIPTYNHLLDDFAGVKHAKVWRLQNVTDEYMKRMGQFTDVMETSHIGFIDRISMEAEFWMPSCRDLVSQMDRMQHIVDYNFDIAIYNDIDPCNPAIVRSFDIPKTILLSSEPIMDKIAWDLGKQLRTKTDTIQRDRISGLPSLPSYIPTVEENPNHDRMGFFDRMSNAYKHFQSIVVHYLQDAGIRKIFQELVDPNFPSIQQIIRNCSVVLVNTDEMFDISRPISSKIVYVGMLGGGEAQPTLPSNLKAIFNKGTKGSVFVSFGTVAPFHILPRRIQMSIYNAIANLPDYHFVLKITNDDKNTMDLFSNVANVELVEWVPQTAVLNHQNLKLFVSHGGMNSVLETMYYGVPMVVMPVFTDQFRNAKNVERRGAGLMIPRENVGNITFLEEIHTVLNEPRYTKNAKRMSRLIQNHPFSPEERVIKWVNYVLDHDIADQFDLEYNNLSLVQIYHIDIFFWFILTPIIIYLISVRYFNKNN